MSLGIGTPREFIHFQPIVELSEYEYEGERFEMHRRVIALGGGEAGRGEGANIFLAIMGVQLSNDCA